jgi:hypothetical protein
LCAIRRRIGWRCGGEALAVIDSPILGMEGNREFLLRARFGA